MELYVSLHPPYAFMEAVHYVTKVWVLLCMIDGDDWISNSCPPVKKSSLLLNAGFKIIARAEGSHFDMYKQTAGRPQP
jgi:hypothetical protein